MGKYSPNFDTILMVEKALLESDDYPSKTQLWKRLPRKMHYSTFKNVIEYLAASNKIEFNNHSIIYIGASDKLKAYLDTFTELK
ncbi:MAG: hypothetical protein NTV61_06835 [Candidatus Bathyarchaeota archaeon]|nr:hypothetical protein [Candidatus Bathyarchaeota archaeon]